MKKVVFKVKLKSIRWPFLFKTSQNAAAPEHPKIPSCDLNTSISQAAGKKDGTISAMVYGLN